MRRSSISTRSSRSPSSVADMSPISRRTRSGDCTTEACILPASARAFRRANWSRSRRSFRACRCCFRSWILALTAICSELRRRISSSIRPLSCCSSAISGCSCWCCARRWCSCSVSASNWWSTAAFSIRTASCGRSKRTERMPCQSLRDCEENESSTRTVFSRYDLKTDIFSSRYLAKLMMPLNILRRRSRVGVKISFRLKSGIPQASMSLVLVQRQSAKGKSSKLNIQVLQGSIKCELTH